MDPGQGVIGPRELVMGNSNERVNDNTWNGLWSPLPYKFLFDESYDTETDGCFPFASSAE
jgi:hypothetical protein